MPAGATLTRRTELHLEAHATCHTTCLQTGGQQAAMETTAHLSTHTRFHHTALTLARGSGQQQTSLTSLLSGESNQCHIRCRNLVDDAAQTTFYGKFLVQPRAQKTESYMHTSTLLLSPAAQSTHQPQLEIYADNVRCSHGATTGTIDNEQLFYLQSRGLPEKEAKNLLITAYTQEFIDIFPEITHTFLHQTLTHWLKSPPITLTS